MFAYILPSGLPRLQSRADQLWVANGDGTGARRLAQDLGGSLGAPAWSPDAPCLRRRLRSPVDLPRSHVSWLGETSRRVSSTTNVPAKAAGLPTVWINRRHLRPGWGATPDPQAPVTPDWAFPSMAAFADAVDVELG